ncbi:MAG TPA: polysaccharide deacetylase family protein [Ktedonobacteraceae bacterium]|nr:polysaccharide deacetylase family protein [Ktedonobacteraceae bacterium]
MRERVRLWIAACFYYSGLVKLAYWRLQRGGPRLVILNYHQASASNLRDHLLYLRRHYRLLHLEAALEELYGAQPPNKRLNDRRMPLVLTFDDGYRDNYTHAFPLAQALQVPMTIFLVPGYIRSGERFWWLEGKRLAASVTTDEATIDGRIYRLSQPGERDALAHAIDTRLRSATSVEQREALLREVRQALRIRDEVIPGEEGERPMTWTEAREMDASAWVSFGAHTMHHPVLAALADPLEIRREVEECRRVLEQELGHQVRAFAYPIGKPEHFGERGVQAVKSAGYTWAVTTCEEVNTPQCDQYLLRRLPGVVEKHWLVMASELVGLLGIVSRVNNYLNLRQVAK